MEKAEQLSNEINTKEGHVLIAWPALLNACLNKKELVIKLLDLFTKQTPGWLEELNESVREGDTQRLRMVCHTVIGASSAIQANACADNLKKLNATAKEDPIDPARLQEELDESVVMLKKTNDAIAEIVIACSDS